MTRSFWRAAPLAITAVLALAGPAAAQDQGVLVSTGSPTGPFPQNKQNEPSVAVDPLHPSTLIAGSNDEIDEPGCVGSDCSFVTGIGNSGVYFSTNGGAAWTQPVYHGFTGRGRGGDSGTPRTGVQGDIGTLPNYDQAGLVSDGDPAVAFGPRFAHGTFSYDNGEQAYYANLASNFSGGKSDEAFRGYEAIAVSHTTDLDQAIAGVSHNANGWSTPRIVSAAKQNAATFSDKEALTVDGTSTSHFFGYAYVCWTDFRSNSTGGQPIVVSRSRDGGSTWSSPKALTPATAAKGGRQGCDIKTDASGVVYAFMESETQGNRGNGILMTRSFDGGASFDKPRKVADVFDIGEPSLTSPGYTDIDGVAGSRADSFPHVAISGSTIALAWADGRNGVGSEAELAQVSHDRGITWTTPANIAMPHDRPVMPGVALSPDAATLYTVYSDDATMFQDSLTGDRTFRGVLLAVPVGPSGLGTPGEAAAETPTGDGRGSSANALSDEFIGDYNQVAATPTGAVALYTSLSDAGVCGAVNTYRQGLVDNADGTSTTPPTKPSPLTDCSDAPFGNTDIKALIAP